MRSTTWPNVALTAPVPIAVAAVTLALLRALAKTQDSQPLYLGAVRALPCRARHQHCIHRAADITVWQAASPENSRLFMLVGVAVLIPLILAYTTWAYRVFRGKVHTGSGYH